MSTPTKGQKQRQGVPRRVLIITVVRRAIPRGNAPRAKKEERQKEKETVTKEKVKERGAGADKFGK